MLRIAPITPAAIARLNVPARFFQLPDPLAKLD